MLPRNGAEGILDSVDLGDGEPYFLASVSFRVGRANGGLLPCLNVIDRRLHDVFGTTFHVRHYRRV